MSDTDRFKLENSFDSDYLTINEQLCPPNRRWGGGHIVFGVDPVGVRVASFPCVIFLTDGRILTKLADTLLGGRNELIRFW